MSRPVTLGLVVALAAVVGVGVWGFDTERAAPEHALEAREHEFEGSAVCRDCHEERWESWRRTYHSTMTQAPSPKSVIGRFDGVELELFGARARPFQRDGRFYFDLPAYDGRPARTAEVALCVGSHRYQQYFEFDQTSGEYRRLPLVWHAVDGRWSHLNAVFLSPDDLDWGAHDATWNENCVFCHNTGPAPKLAGAATGTPSVPKRFDTHVAELGIACESCHGPGEAHVAGARAPFSEWLVELGFVELGDALDPRELPPAEANAVCGQCHSQRLPDPLDKLMTYLDTGPTFRAGDTLVGHVAPITCETPSVDPANPELFRRRFWSDGTPRLSAYEYLGVTQSPCKDSSRFTCNACHRMHSGDPAGMLEPEFKSDRACTQCHEELARDVASHTHHAAKSPGSRCLECHMPRIVYGIVDVHRSHRIESPDVARDVEGGRPNACASCHLDQPAAELAAAMRAWWGEHYTNPRSRPDGASLELPEALASLHAGDAVQRAVYAKAFGRADAALDPRGSAWAAAQLVIALGDGYPAIRTLARRSLVALDQRARLGLGPVLARYDALAPAESRAAVLKDLVGATASLLADGAATLPPELLIDAHGAVDLERVRALLDLQGSNVISIGE
ncbi:MAG: hypothetical protein L6Q99_19155 [Planctomycetes bacterium]|nr:hypothetical protein [Planctomycetota bacterium]